MTGAEGPGGQVRGGQVRGGQVRVRPMRWWDIEAVEPIERDLFGAGAWSVETFWSELAQVASRSYLLVEDGAGNPVGFGGVGVNGAEADVYTLAIARAAQRRGWGALLLHELVGIAAARGATSLMLEVRAGNAAAIELYRRFGFERIAVRRGYYQPDGEDAWIMRLRPLAGPRSGQGAYL
jgi:ribosomal-protein-alanine N-acetyltransferase